MTQIQECRGGCKGTHPTICEQEGCAIVQGEYRRAKKEEKMDATEQAVIAAAEPPLECVVRPCPFCGNKPETYVIGKRPQRHEKGQAMVRCKTGGCGLWGNPMSLDKWQRRA